MLIRRLCSCKLDLPKKNMFTIVLTAQITVLAAGSRLSPEEAVRVLQASRSELNRTGAIPLESLDGPIWVTVPRPAPLPLTIPPRVMPSITFRIPHTGPRR